MDEHGLPIVGAGVDYTKVPSLEHKNTLVMLNKFLIHTTKFLNRFASVCEERLSDLSIRIQRLDISLSILEAKLSSIRSLDGVQATQTYEPPSAVATAGNITAPTSQPQPSQPSSGPAPPPPPSSGDEPMPQPTATGESAEPAKGGMKIKDHPEYQRFFKMKRLGVNPLQIAMEMKSKGLDPDLLEDEDAPAPEAGLEGAGNPAGSPQDSDEESSMSSEESDDSFESD